MGLHPWAVVRGYRWVGYECRIGAGGDPILPTDYLPRRLMGEYLAWFYDTLVAYAPPNPKIVRHDAAAVEFGGPPRAARGCCSTTAPPSLSIAPCGERLHASVSSDCPSHMPTRKLFGLWDDPSNWE